MVCDLIEREGMELDRTPPTRERERHVGIEVIIDRGGGLTSSSGRAWNLTDPPPPGSARDTSGLRCLSSARASQSAEGCLRIRSRSGSAVSLRDTAAPPCDEHIARLGLAARGSEQGTKLRLRTGWIKLGRRAETGSQVWTEGACQNATGGEIWSDPRVLRGELGVTLPGAAQYRRWPTSLCSKIPAESREIREIRAESYSSPFVVNFCSEIR